MVKIKKYLSKIYLNYNIVNNSNKSKYHIYYKIKN